MENNIITNNRIGVEPIHNLHELLEISKKVQEIMQQIKVIEENHDLENYVKKMLKMQLQDKLDNSNYIIRLTKGITINRDNLINEIIDKVIQFLQEKGYDSGVLINRLKNIKFYVSDIPLISNGGQFDNMNSLIGIDWRYCVFDENGNFLKLDDKKSDVLIHALSHELFHELSRIKKDQPLSDALNEGMTEVFARNISRKYNLDVKSSLYDFIEKICELLTFMVGFDKVFVDYIDDPIELTCVCELFNECGKSKSEFNSFKNELNRFLELKNKKVDCSEIEKTIVIYLKQSIVVPYIKKHPELIDEIIERFNTIFGNYELLNQAEIEKSKVN